jgi:hypothetical protein
MSKPPRNALPSQGRRYFSLGKKTEAGQEQADNTKAAQIAKRGRGVSPIYLDEDMQSSVMSRLKSRKTLAILLPDKGGDHAQDFIQSEAGTKRTS